MTAQTPVLSRTDWILLLALSGLWGGSFFFYKVLVGALPPVTIVLGRVALAAPPLALVITLRGEAWPRSKAVWLAFAGMGVLNNVIPFTLIVWGETRISSGLASILNATTPLFGVLVAHALTTTEKLTWRRGAGVLVGFAGVIVLIGPDAFSDLGGETLIGGAACLLAAVSYAFAGIYGRRFRGIPPLAVATGQLTTSAIIMTPLAFAIDRPWTLANPGLGAWAALLALAFFSTAMAYILYFRLLATAGATNLLLVTFLLPISALLLGTLALGEVIAPNALVGMVLIAGGLAAIDGRLFAHVRRLA